MAFDSIKCKTCTFDCSNHDDLSTSEINLLASGRREITYKKGETIFKQSTYISHIVYVRSGIIKVFTEGYNDKNIILRFVKKGEYIGLPFLFNNNYSYFTATALNNVELCLIEKNIFAELVLNNLVLEKQIINTISKDTGILYKKITSLGTKQLHGRLAAAILALTGEDFNDEDIFSYLTKRELAEFSGMSVESLMRLLNELKSDRIIIQEGKRLIINDFDILVKLSQIG